MFWVCSSRQGDNTIGGGGGLFSTAFSVPQEKPSQPASLTTTTGTSERRRRDFLITSIGLLTTATISTSPFQLGSNHPGVALAATATVVESSSAALSSQNSTVVASKGGRRFGTLANRIRSVGHIMVGLIQNTFFSLDVSCSRWIGGAQMSIHG
jgi:hypothetical protein